MTEQSKEFSLEGLDKLADANKLAAAKAEAERLQKIEAKKRAALIKTFAPMSKAAQKRGGQ